MSVTSRRLVLQGAVFGAVCACAASGFAAPARAADTPGGKYVCPPCGCESDGKLFDAPGACPSCGMPLIPAPKAEPKPREPAPKARDAAPEQGFVAPG